MGFTQAIYTCLKLKYATFNGRASRSEYWWFFLFNIIINLILYIAFIIVPIIFISSQSYSSLYGNEYSSFYLLLLIPLIIWVLFAFLPMLSVTIRRLHDINLSGWWVLIPIIIAGARMISPLATISQLAGLFGLVINIIFIVLFCVKGSKGVNRFGDDPLEYKSQ